MQPDHVTARPRRVLAFAALVFVLLASACGGGPDAAESAVQPAGADSNAPQLANAQDPLPAADLSQGDGNTTLPPAHESGAIPSLNDAGVWDWSWAGAPIAHFQGFLLQEGAVSAAPWPGPSVDYIGESAASACVDGDAYNAVRGAFGGDGLRTFELNGDLWQFVVVDPRTNPDLSTRC